MGTPAVYITDRSGKIIQIQRNGLGTNATNSLEAVLKNVTGR